MQTTSLVLTRKNYCGVSRILKLAISCAADPLVGTHVDRTLSALAQWSTRRRRARALVRGSQSTRWRQCRVGNNCLANKFARFNVCEKEESPGRLAEPGALSTGTAWLRDAARPNLISQVATPKPQRRSRNWNRMAPTKSGRSHPAKMARPWNASAPSGNAHHAQHFNREALAAQAVQTAMNSGRSLYIERSRSARIGQHRNVKWGSVLRRWSGRVAACEEIIG